MDIHFPRVEDLLLSGRIIEMFWSGMHQRVSVRWPDRRVIDDKIKGEDALAKINSVVDQPLALTTAGHAALHAAFSHGLQINTLRAEQGTIVAEFRQLGDEVENPPTLVRRGRGMTVDAALIAAHNADWEVETNPQYQWGG